MRRAITLSAITAACLAAGTPTALAAPPEPETFTLVCDDGQTIEIEVNGNGEFTPGRIVGSTSVLVPVSFGNFYFRAESPTGELLAEGEFPGSAKGGGNVAQRNPRPMVTCVFEETEVLEEYDEEFDLPAGTIVTFGGSVTGMISGR
jgi:hypothetical protein